MPLQDVYVLYKSRRFLGNVASNLRTSGRADAHYTLAGTAINMVQTRHNNLNMHRASNASINVRPVLPYDHWQARGLCRCRLRLTSGGQSVPLHKLRA